jgi:hypothetical protein
MRERTRKATSSIQKQLHRFQLGQHSRSSEVGLPDVEHSSETQIYSGVLRVFRIILEVLGFKIPTLSKL